ncbi:MAG TPA: glycosyltransferase family 4 protein [Prolixibacteraceae bacterium]|nr:glycosyltransferase family 4 protein [Prolixibacteraceae bacterium]
MKIAVLAPIAWRTPPQKYGPWEQVCSNIAEGLVERGVEVTLFATGNSRTKGKLEYVSPTAYCEDPTIIPKVWECLHISLVMERSAEFDVIHNNFDFLPLTYSRLIKTPLLTTIHGFSSPGILPVYKKYNVSNYYVSISDSDRSRELDYMATVYNGINTRDFTFNDKPDDYLLYFGRIHPEKGTFESIQIARQAGRKLIISGLIQDEAYFQNKIKPLINDKDIVYVGNSGPKERNELLGNAFALLHPISFEEPFGLSVAEAMICGTPVIAFHRGSMPELIEEGKTGFLIADIDQAVKALEKLGTLDRSYVSRYAISKFSREKMVDHYMEIYQKIISLKG